MDSIMRVTGGSFKPLYQRVSELPDELGLTIADIAKHTGISASTLRNLEKEDGKRGPNFSTIEKLASGIEYAPVLLYLKEQGTDFFVLQARSWLAKQEYSSLGSRKRRKELGMRQMDLTARLEISETSLASYETRYKRFNSRTSERLWNELGLHPRYLVKLEYSHDEINSMLSAGTAQLALYLELASEILTPKEIRKMTKGLLRQLERI